MPCPHPGRSHPGYRSLRYSAGHELGRSGTGTASLLAMSPLPEPHPHRFPLWKKRRFSTPSDWVSILLTPSAPLWEKRRILSPRFWPKCKLQGKLLRTLEGISPLTAGNFRKIPLFRRGKRQVRASSPLTMEPEGSAVHLPYKNLSIRMQKNVLKQSPNPLLQ